jgi:membrane-associated phospholipid phosphatase
MDSTALITAISDLGDSAVITAIAVVAAIDLAWSGYRRAALILIAVLVAAAGAIGFLKVAVIGCSGGRFGPELNSPSGHAAISAAVLGTLSFVVGTQFRDWRRFIAPTIAIVLIILIGATRVLLGAHTVDEVVVGLAAGAAVVLPAVLLLRRSRVVRVRLGVLLCAIAITAAVTDGVRAPAEELVYYVAMLVHRTVPMCADAALGAPHGPRRPTRLAGAD